MNKDVVILIDVDNTLLDNDRIIADLHDHLERNFGNAAEKYWTTFEALRDELGYVDYLGALQRWRSQIEDKDGAAHKLLAVSGFLIDYPFVDRLYPDALKVIERLGEFGTPVILTDGDVVFQPRKIQRSGLWDAVEGRVLIYVHKEEMLDEMQKAYPAERYVMVDDKQRILTAMKDKMGDRLETVFPKQGHYALDPENIARFPAADSAIERIGDLLTLDLDSLLASRR
ncbi:MAG: haloacid dehalogenase [Rhizobacter sp.]|nr:haloacid dehalogenase [Rhizobacter sp.]